MNFLLKQLHDFKVHGELGLTKKLIDRSIHTVNCSPKQAPVFVEQKQFVRKPARREHSKYCFQVVEGQKVVSSGCFLEQACQILIVEVGTAQVPNCNGPKGFAFFFSFPFPLFLFLNRKGPSKEPPFTFVSA